LLHYLFPHITPSQFDFVHGALRKTGHFLGYATLSFLCYRSWWTTLQARSGATALKWRDMTSRWMWRAAVLALLVTLAVAAADEYHQGFEPGRTPSLIDVTLDEMGGILAQSLIVAISFGSRKKPDRRLDPVVSS
jgi:VanZ family protein